MTSSSTKELQNGAKTSKTQTIVYEDDQSLVQFVTLVQALSSRSVLGAVSDKLFDHFTIWELVSDNRMSNPSRIKQHNFMFRC